MSDQVACTNPKLGLLTLLCSGYIQIDGNFNIRGSNEIFFLKTNKEKAKYGNE